MSRSFLVGLILGLILNVSHPESVFARNIDPAKVPEEVTKAFNAKYPRAKIAATYEDQDGSDLSYRFEIAAGKSSTTVAISAKGEITKIDQQVPNTKLPKAVLDTALKKYPQGKVNYAGEVTAYKEDKPQGKTYRIVSILPSKKRMILELSANGTIKQEKEDKDGK